VSSHYVTGVDDFVVHVAYASMADLQRVVLDEVTSRTEVGRVETHPIFGSWNGGPTLLPTSLSG
jgi:DNA-binding Lrp family transcriptional regulator